MTPSHRHEFVTRSSRTVYEGAILALRVDDVEMPGGRTARREVVEHHGAVAVVARDDEGRIAMVRQYRHPIGRRLLELPAGLLDGGPDEDPLTAAQRELAEETDLAADRWRVLVDLAVSPGFTDEALRVYLAEGLHHLDAAEREDEEADMVLEWVPLADAVNLALSGEIVNATAAAGVLAAAAAAASDRPLRSTDAPWQDQPTAFAARK
ncbi:NUDIX hydrolase [Gordonia sp. (in: high G+C Gram-positive bacteria)]|uniref:NUDIX domain-containing protein n=1 Tax=Gordonia sp. (in: high G+C Gram-positive bacteria) TaxID=84139 RepID=UPI0016A24F65|nr:NUDIX hydrolase [Gordonia sp. (in: high G+C Gram-positive bacteria)]NLG48088.1 NUDIX hydrolase [Gordonia sp. (in: high G+C Gram-positive bacteria)]